MIQYMCNQSDDGHDWLLCCFGKLDEEGPALTPRRNTKYHPTEGMPNPKKENQSPTSKGTGEQKRQAAAPLEEREGPQRSKLRKKATFPGRERKLPRRRRMEKASATQQRGEERRGRQPHKGRPAKPDKQISTRSPTPEIEANPKCKKEGHILITRKQKT